MKQVLHVGCGAPSPTSLYSFFRVTGFREVRLDIDPDCKPEIISSITEMPMIADCSYDAIYSSHNLEHLFPQEVPEALGEFHRVLKPGGIALVTMPDIQDAAEMIVNDGLEETAYMSPCGPVWPMDCVYGHRITFADKKIFALHKTAFTATRLKRVLKEAGFEYAHAIRDNFILWGVARKAGELVID
ncbi:methyltransferase domain-containing protein [Chitinimonas sp.]|uniref:class I SAM-dependent methyltransferase n=1 Tax=Chitinimonas sp. TaxID=1934313 RepID=UPI0035B0DE17